MKRRQVIGHGIGVFVGTLFGTGLMKGCEVPRPVTEATAEPAESCSTCRFYHDGFCHRYPPQTHFSQFSGQISQFPRVAPDDICGEHKPV